MIETLLVGFGRFGKEHLSAWEATGRAQISAIVDPTLTIAVSSLSAKAAESVLQRSNRKT